MLLAIFSAAWHIPSKNVHGTPVMILGESVWQGGQEEGQSGQIALQVPNLGESPENPGAAGEQGSGGSGR